MKRQSKSGTIGTRTNGPPMDGLFLSVFVSRLDPSVSCDDLIAFVKDVHKVDVNCDRLETRYDS